MGAPAIGGPSAAASSTSAGTAIAPPAVAPAPIFSELKARLDALWNDFGGLNGTSLMMEQVCGCPNAPAFGHHLSPAAASELMTIRALLETEVQIAFSHPRAEVSSDSWDQEGSELTAHGADLSRRRQTEPIYLGAGKAREAEGSRDSRDQEGYGADLDLSKLYHQQGGQLSLLMEHYYFETTEDEVDPMESGPVFEAVQSPSPTPPTPEPTAEPTPEPSMEPTEAPTAEPTSEHMFILTPS